jgi:effector-binding domain-containing protein
MATNDVRFDTLEPQATAALRVREPMSTVDVGRLFGEAMQRLGARLGEVGAAPAGAPFARYHAWGGEIADIEIGLPLAAQVEGLDDLADVPEGEVGASTLPGGPVAVIIHRGPVPDTGRCLSAPLGGDPQRGSQRGVGSVGVLRRRSGAGRGCRHAPDRALLAAGRGLTAAV